MGVAPTGFGPYLLVSKLGHGGMGEAFLALTRSVGDVYKPWVVKRLHPYYLDEPTFIRMFMDEARLAARLSHPNVVHTTDVGEVDGLYYLTMEYLEGRSLDQVFRRARDRETPVPITVLSRMVADALAGLHYAHELNDYDGTPLNVVHRDVSPGNLFVTSHGVVKLLDFGIAKATIQEAKTQTGSIKGKVEYMAPEQVLGPSVDRRADVWSMGVLLYQALTGVSIFKGPTEVDTLRNVMDADIEELIGGLGPNPLIGVLRRSLQRDRDSRYATAATMRHDVTSCLDQSIATSQDVADFVKMLFGDEITAQRAKLGKLIADPLHDRPPSFEAESGSSQPPTVPNLPNTLTAVERPSAFPDRQRRRPPWIAVAVVATAATIVGAALALRDNDERRAPVDESRRPTSSDSIEPTGPVSNRGRPSPPDHTHKIAPAETLLGSTVPVNNAGTDSTDGPRPSNAHSGPPSATVGEASEGTPRPPRAAAVRRPRRPHRAQPSGPDSPEPATIATGRLSLDTVPWTSVTIDGRLVGTTPLLGLELPAGEHTVRLTNSEMGLDEVRQIRIQPGETTRRRLSLFD